MPSRVRVDSPHAHAHTRVAATSHHPGLNPPARPLVDARASARSRHTPQRHRRTIASYSTMPCGPLTRGFT